MKYIYHISLFLLCSVFYINSAEAQVYIGPKLGIGPSSLKFDPELPTHSSKGEFLNIVAGIVAEKPIIGGLSVQLEAQYVGKGGTLESNGRGAPSIEGGSFYFDRNNNGAADEDERFTIPDLYAGYDINLKYVEVPLMVKYELFFGSVGYFAEVGPTLSYGLTAEAVPEYADIDGSIVSTEILYTEDGFTTSNYNDIIADEYAETIDLFEPNTLRQFKKTDFGITLGLGVAFDLGVGRLYADARQVFGMSNLDERGTSSTVKNSSFQISAAYVFPFGGY